MRSGMGGRFPLSQPRRQDPCSLQPGVTGLCSRGYCCSPRSGWVLGSTGMKHGAPGQATACLVSFCSKASSRSVAPRCPLGRPELLPGTRRRLSSARREQRHGPRRGVAVRAERGLLCTRRWSCTSGASVGCCSPVCRAGGLRWDTRGDSAWRLNPEQENNGRSGGGFYLLLRGK